MLSTGLGKEVKFDCLCGTRNQRRVKCLIGGKVISCVNPECSETWEVDLESDEVNFTGRGEAVKCKCGVELWVPRADIEKLPKGQYGSMICSCGAQIVMRWSLQHAVQSSAEEA